MIVLKLKCDECQRLSDFEVEHDFHNSTVRRLNEIAAHQQWLSRPRQSREKLRQVCPECLGKLIEASSRASRAPSSPPDEGVSDERTEIDRGPE